MRPLHRVLLVCALTTFAASASATSSRVDAMGGGDDYFEDVTNVLRWYGSLASYGGTALFEYGQDENGNGYSDRRAASILAELAPAGAWGVGGLFLAAQDPDDVLRLAWGKDLGRLQIGVQWRLYWDEYGYDNSTISERAELYFEDQVYGAGARLKLGPRTYLDAAADLAQTYRHLDAGVAGTFESGYGHDTWSTRFRLFHGLSERTAIVPLLEFQRWIGPRYEWTQDNFLDSDRHRYAVGLGWNHLPDADTMIVGSFTYAYNDIAEAAPKLDGGPTSRDVTNNIYRLRFGVERRMLTWLTLRAGVWQMLWNQDTRTLAAPEAEIALVESGGESLEMSLGLAIHMGPFDADLVFRDNAPFNFGSALTQAGSYEDATWNKITLQYVF